MKARDNEFLLDFEGKACDISSKMNSTQNLVPDRGIMIRKDILNSLLDTFDIQSIEKHLVYCYLDSLKLDYSKSPILEKYLENFELNTTLFLEASMLHINSLKKLECYLELLIPSKDKKVNGAFFTPQYVVDFIINQIKPKADDRTLDPSCGCGAFLIGLVEYYQKNFHKAVKEIIMENLFGTDILDYNIRRAKILLSILAIRNSEILQETDFNLASIDSLRVNWKQCFDRNPSGRFENIVGNPPYVKFQDLSDQNRSFLGNHWAAIQGGTFNLYFAFFELGYNLLNENGLLGYITPNNYFTSLAGESLRKYFQKKKCVTRIIDFNCKKVFDAQTYTAITFLNKKENHAICYDRINEDQTPELFLKNVNGSPNLLSRLNVKKWRLLKTEEQENIRLIETAGTPLNRLFDICVGIATLRDELYFIDGRLQKGEYYLKSLENKIFKIEKRITKSVYKISDFSNQLECDQNSRRIIFPYFVSNGAARCICEVEMKEKFPECYNYFIHVRGALNEREKGKINIEPFYAYGRTQGLARRGKKILTPTFSQQPRFVLVSDEDALFCNGYALYFRDAENMPLLPFDIEQTPLLSKIGNIKVVQKILNSCVMDYYVRKTSVSIEGGYPCYQKNFIEKFSIPPLTNDELNTLRTLTDPKEIDMFLVKKYQIDIALPNLVE